MHPKKAHQVGVPNRPKAQTFVQMTVTSEDVLA